MVPGAGGAKAARVGTEDDEVPASADPESPHTQGLEPQPADWGIDNGGQDRAGSAARDTGGHL